MPQGDVISPTLFDVHINDIEKGILRELCTLTCKYADDCKQYQLVPLNSKSRMKDVVNHLESWAAVNDMEINAKKTNDMWISFKETSDTPSPLHINNVELERVTQFKLLGVEVQNDLKGNSFITNIVSKASKRIYHVRSCRKANIPAEVGLTIYITKIRTLLEYASPIWGGLPEYLSLELQRVQHSGLRIFGLPKDTLESLEQRRDAMTRNQLERILESSNFNHLFQQPL